MLHFYVWSLLFISFACAVVAAVSLEKNINHEESLNKNKNKNLMYETVLTNQTKTSFTKSKNFYFILFTALAFIFLMLWNIAFYSYAPELLLIK